jgi:hypothetical protein
MCSRADHSGLMLAARITFAHVSVYSATKLPNSADEFANGSSPKSTSRALNVGSARAALTCLLRIAMISGARKGTKIGPPGLGACGDPS